MIRTKYIIYFPDKLCLGLLNDILYKAQPEGKCPAPIRSQAGQLFGKTDLEREAYSCNTST